MLYYIQNSKDLIIFYGLFAEKNGIMFCLKSECVNYIESFV